MQLYGDVYTNVVIITMQLCGDIYTDVVIIAMQIYGEGSLQCNYMEMFTLMQ